jgi:hypothetical protein
MYVSLAVMFRRSKHFRKPIPRLRHLLGSAQVKMHHPVEMLGKSESSAEPRASLHPALELQQAVPGESPCTDRGSRSLQEANVMQENRSYVVTFSICGG